ncbi:hypothetical protein Q7P37_003997 [Cladosporium fusiforme]
MPPSVLLHGSGAIGTIYLYLLLRAGCSVTAVCRSNYDAVKTHGFTIDSDKYGKGIHVQPTNVVRTPSEAAGPFDFVIVATKALPGQKPSTPEIIRPAITAGKTTIVLIQNGIGIETEYATAYPTNPLISCVVYLPTTQTSPGHIHMGKIELLQIGTYPATSEPSSPAYAAAQTLQTTLRAGGGNAELHNDIQAQRWSKLLINASWNPICALSLSRDVAFLASSSLAEKLVADVMDEVVLIAQAKGHTSVSASMAREQLARALERKGTKRNRALDAGGRGQRAAGRGGSDSGQPDTGCQGGRGGCAADGDAVCVVEGFGRGCRVEETGREFGWR